MRDVKKMLMSGLAVGLTVSITVAGTLAYLKAGEDGDVAVTNTFVAAGNGKLITDGGLWLKEHRYSNETKKLDLSDEAWVTANRYETLQPGMVLPKDPTLYVDLEEGAPAYVFVKVTNETGGVFNTTTSGGGTEDQTSGGKNPSQIGYGTTYNIYLPASDQLGAESLMGDWALGINTEDWEVLNMEELLGIETQSSGKTRMVADLYAQAAILKGTRIYYYKGAGASGGVITGTAGIEINQSRILKGQTDEEGEEKTRQYGIVKTNDLLGDVNETEEGMQLGELKFQAFVCQAGGFDSPEDAFKKCFSEYLPLASQEP